MWFSWKGIEEINFFALFAFFWRGGIKGNGWAPFVVSSQGNMKNSTKKLWHSVRKICPTDEHSYDKARKWAEPVHCRRTVLKVIGGLEFTWNPWHRCVFSRLKCEDGLPKKYYNKLEGSTSCVASFWGSESILWSALRKRNEKVLQALIQNKHCKSTVLQEPQNHNMVTISFVRFSAEFEVQLAWR